MSGLQQPVEIFDSRGQPLRLGRRIGQGGEGTVFEIVGIADTVAKIYSQPMLPQRAEKIRAMTAMRTAEIEKLTAWPTELLTLRSGAPVGLTMPMIVGHKDIHQLYSPKSRRSEFPRADWRFLVRAAANICRAFATVHEASSVIADVNHGGVLVAQDARVRLIDCDSFQVAAAGKRYLCDVGVPIFTPPELQGLAFTGLVRTPNHDNFGLAVLIFLMLFMGRHPFAGRYLGSGEMPVERAIREHRFAYGVNHAAAQMQPPPGTAPLSILSAPVVRLFERAFARDAARAGRPTARDWMAALDALEGELVQCTASASHWHVAGLQDCPWCRMEGATGVGLFSATASVGATRYFDLDAFWKQITALEPPGPLPALVTPVGEQRIPLSPYARQFRRRRRFHLPIALFVAALPLSAGILVDVPVLARLFFIVTAIILFVLVKLVLKAQLSTIRFVERERAYREQWEGVLSEWKAKAGPGSFDARRVELERLRGAWRDLDSIRTRRMAETAAGKEMRQRRRFLESFEVADAEVPGLTPRRKSLLESFGIETAADIDEKALYTVPDFGVKLIDDLIAWRAAVERSFRFDASQPDDIQEIDLIEREMLVHRARLEAEFRRGLQDLQQLRNQILFARTSLHAKGQDAYIDHLQAAADLKAVTK